MSRYNQIRTQLAPYLILLALTLLSIGLGIIIQTWPTTP